MKRYAIIFLASVAIVHAGCLTVIRLGNTQADKTKILQRAYTQLQITNTNAIPFWQDADNSNKVYQVLYVAQDVKHNFTAAQNGAWKTNNLSPGGRGRVKFYETDNPKYVLTNTLSLKRKGN